MKVKLLLLTQNDDKSDISSLACAKTTALMWKSGHFSVFCKRRDEVHKSERNWKRRPVWPQADQGIRFGSLWVTNQLFRCFWWTNQLKPSFLDTFNFITSNKKTNKISTLDNKIHTWVGWCTLFIVSAASNWCFKPLKVRWQTQKGPQINHWLENPAQEHRNRKLKT